MRPHIPTGVLMFAATTLLGCAPTLTVGSSAASDLQPSAYRTYMWETPDALPTGDPRLDNNPFFVQTLQQAADSQLAKLGLSRAVGTADLVVHFHATVRDRVSFYEVDRAAGMDQSGYPRATEAQQYEEGTVLLDMAEVKGKKLIWRGWMQTDISGAIGNNAVLGKRLRDGMVKLFAQFPAGCISR